MKFEIIQAVSVLERTPSILNTMLKDLDDGWTMENEGGETWSPLM